MSRSARLASIPDAWWARIAAAPHRLLMLDYDGTLAPFVVDRDQARPYPPSLERLRALAACSHTSLAIVSGRPLRQLQLLLGELEATLVGEHGWEWRARGGEIVREPLHAEAVSALDAAVHLAREAGWGELLEHKRTAVVLHTRALTGAGAKEVADRAFERWRSLVGPHVVLDRIDGGVELRARGRDKGSAVETLLARSAPGTLGVFVGDDVTDEDAFQVLETRGLGIRVGSHERPTRARARLASYEEVPAFLAEWARVVGADAGEGTS